MSELPNATNMIAEVHKAASELRNFTISFLSLLLYVSLIIASTTHEQILRIDPVKLPLLNVDIPIVGFYAVMPVFLLLMHLYLLVQYYLFSQQVFLFDSVLQQEPAEVQYHLRRNLGNLPFLHWLLGQHAGVMRLIMTLTTVISLIIWPLWTLLWLQMTFLPYHDQNTVTLQQSCLVLDVLFLLYLWAKILDPNDNAGKWWFAGLANEVVHTIHRFSLLWQTWLLLAWYSRLRPDKWLVIWWQSGKLSLQSSGGWRGFFSRLYHNLQRLLLLALLLVVVFVSLFVSVLPMFEEKYLLKYYPESWLVTLNPLNGNVSPRKAFILTAWLHEQREVQLSTGQIQDYDLLGRIRPCPNKGTENQNKLEPTSKCFLVDGLIPRNLILRERILVENKLTPKLIVALSSSTKSLLNVPKIQPNILSEIIGLNLQSRHLEYADFSNSSLPKADLRRTRLREAIFDSASMNEALLQQAQLNQASLNFASLNGADLSFAELNDANLKMAELNGAYLIFTKLNGADLSVAKLNGANLFSTSLNDANLGGTEINGADLSADLIGANLEGAKINGSNLIAAWLCGANLNGTILNASVIFGCEKVDLENSEVRDKINDFRITLQNLPKYQSIEGQRALDKRVESFIAKLKQPSNFLNIQHPISPCLSISPFTRKQANCADLKDKIAKKNAFNYLYKQACEDNTQNHWIAKAMLSAQLGFVRKLLKIELAKGEACPGIAALPEEWKQKLAVSN